MIIIKIRRMDEAVDNDCIPTGVHRFATMEYSRGSTSFSYEYSHKDKSAVEPYDCMHKPVYKRRDDHTVMPGSGHIEGKFYVLQIYNDYLRRHDCYVQANMNILNQDSHGRMSIPDTVILNKEDVIEGKVCTLLIDYWYAAQMNSLHWMFDDRKSKVKLIKQQES